jgi:hypothetical protein
MTDEANDGQYFRRPYQGAALIDEYSEALREKAERRAAGDKNGGEFYRTAGSRARHAAESFAEQLKSALDQIPNMLVKVRPLSMGTGREGPVASVDIDGDRADFKVHVVAHVEWQPVRGDVVGKPEGAARMTVLPARERPRALDVPGIFNLDGTYALDGNGLRKAILEALRSS